MRNDDWDTIGETLSDAAEPYLRSTQGKNMILLL